jgi:hypothetical protein
VFGPDSFFSDEVVDDRLQGAFVTRTLRDELLADLAKSPLASVADAEVAAALVRLLRDELERYGTDGTNELDDNQVRLVIASLRAVLSRLRLTLDLPFRDFTGFRTFWKREDMAYSWQARRDYVDLVFSPLEDSLDVLVSVAVPVLAEPVSPRAATGWQAVDEELDALRRRFREAQTSADYRAVGLHALGVLEAVGDHVHDPTLDLREGETSLSREKSKARLERYIERSLTGPTQADLRALARKAIEVAQAVKHGATPTRRDAGIAADAAILVANMLRRLVE